MDKIGKALEKIDAVLDKLDTVLEIQKEAMEAAQQRMNAQDTLNMLTHHDMYRQLKAECKETEDKIQSAKEVREGVQHNGYVWEYRWIMRKIEKYADTWLRLLSNKKED